MKAIVIASKAKQSRGHTREDWIASSLALLAKTGAPNALA